MLEAQAPQAHYGAGALQGAERSSAPDRPQGELFAAVSRFNAHHEDLSVINARLRSLVNSVSGEDPEWKSADISTTRQGLTGRVHAHADGFANQLQEAELLISCLEQQI